MIFKIKNVLSKMALPSLGIVLSLNLSPAQAMNEAMNDSLPEDVLVSTFKMLPEKDLGRCALVCSRWKKISSVDALWEEVARSYAEGGKKFPLMFFGYSSIFPLSWKEILMKTYKYNKKQEEEKKRREIERENERKRLSKKGMSPFEIEFVLNASYSLESILSRTGFSFEGIKNDKIKASNSELLKTKLLELEQPVFEPVEFDFDQLFHHEY